MVAPHPAPPPEDPRHTLSAASSIVGLSPAAPEVREREMGDVRGGRGRGERGRGKRRVEGEMGSEGEGRELIEGEGREQKGLIEGEGGYLSTQRAVK